MPFSGMGGTDQELPEQFREDIKDFSGVCVTDGYLAYHAIENECEGLKIAGCWSHARRRFDEAVKAKHRASCQFIRLLAKANYRNIWMMLTAPFWMTCSPDC